MEIDDRVLDLRAQGLSCSQILMKVVGIDARGTGGEELVTAMGGLTYGMHCQHTCGALTGAACALAMYGASRETLCGWCNELSAWFIDRFKSERCRDILGEAGKSPTVCTAIIQDTIEKCIEILEDAAYL